MQEFIECGVHCQGEMAIRVVQDDRREQKHETNTNNITAVDGAGRRVETEPGARTPPGYISYLPSSSGSTVSSHLRSRSVSAESDVFSVEEDLSRTLCST